jgi:biopolymer transport protein ExbD
VRFKRKSKTEIAIPTASMADIAFLLLIFFMVTTIFRLEDGIPIVFPKAEQTEKVPIERVCHIWIDKQGTIVINDKQIPFDQVENLMHNKMAENPNLIVAFNVDEKAKYRLVSDVIEILKRVNALRVSFTARMEGVE